MVAARRLVPLAVFAFFAMAAAAKEVEVGGWKILSGQSSAGGVTYCTVQEDDEDSHIALQVTLDGQFILAAMSKDWQWTPGERYRSKWVVENGAEWSGEALAVMPTVVILSVPPTPNPVEALAAGKSVTVTVAGAEEEYSLEDIGAAVAVLKHCLANKGEF